MRSIILLSACLLSATVIAADIAVPIAVFGAEAAEFTVEGKPSDTAGGKLALPAGMAVAVAWKSTGGSPGAMKVIAVDATTGNCAPEWAEKGDPGIAFTSGSTIAMARDKAMMRARQSLAMGAAGGQRGTVTATISGSTANDMVITISADAAQAPAYEPPAGRTRLLAKAEATGTPGQPLVRCWVRVTGKVELEK